MAGYIAVRPGLLGLLGIFFILNLSAAPVFALLSPLVLRFARPIDLGVVSSSGGAAFLLAGLLMSAWGGPPRRIHAVLPVGILMGVSMVLMGAQASVPLVAVFVFAFGQPVVNAANATLWQTKVPPGLQGRVLALLRMSAWSPGPVALLVSGPLADRVLEPLLQPNGALAGRVGRIIGVGPGRGIALLFILTALLPIGAAIAGYLWPAVRDVERGLPDATPYDDAGTMRRAG